MHICRTHENMWCVLSFLWHNPQQWLIIQTSDLMMMMKGSYVHKKRTLIKVVNFLLKDVKI